MADLIQIDILECLATCSAGDNILLLLDLSRLTLLETNHLIVDNVGHQHNFRITYNCRAGKASTRVVADLIGIAHAHVCIGAG